MKKIIFNTSSLISLKAELIKKQQEVKEKKSLPEHKVEHFKPAPAKSSVKNEDKSFTKKTFKERLNESVAEELEAFRKSRAALEKKAELYEHLADGAGTSQLAGSFLVDFNTKKKQTSPERIPEEDVAPEEEEEDSFNDLDDSDWTEFTDCLGRTRKCLKTDLELYIIKDKKLMDAIIKDKQQQQEQTDKQQQQPEKQENQEESQAEQPTVEKSLLVQKTNDYLQSLREKWERKEQELMGKDRDIHYQDILYDEARQHGVGYYSFSTDEVERRRQMDELMALRRETVRAQLDAEAQRTQRDQLIKARLDAAKARRRKLLGLPDDDPEEQKEKFTEKLLELLVQEKNAAEAKAKEEERRIREEKDKERQKLREAYVREWDVGKDGVEEKKGFREMTQEEYVEQQRDKRIEEFAPVPQTSRASQDSYQFDDRGNKISENPTKSWSDVRKFGSAPVHDASSYQDTKGLYFSSISSRQSSRVPVAPPTPTISHSESYREKRDVQYKNFVKSDDYTPIRNELSDDEEPSRAPDKRKSSNNAEIAPPPTYEYYGPTSKHRRTQAPFKSDLREAYAQGTKRLEAKESKTQLAKEYDFIL